MSASVQVTVVPEETQYRQLKDMDASLSAPLVHPRSFRSRPLLPLLALASLVVLFFSQGGPGCCHLAAFFRTRPPVRFLALGDWGRDGAYNQSLIAHQMGVFGDIMSVQFVISVGDNYYDTGLDGPYDTQFTSTFTNVYTASSLQVPFFSVLGNHDYYGNSSAQLDPILRDRDWRWICRRSMRFTRSLCHPGEVSCTSTIDFFLYDTVPLISKYHTSAKVSDWSGVRSDNWTAQADSQLAEMKHWLRTSTATWKVVIGHHPLYSYGHHGNEKELIKYLQPMMEKHGVDLYMNGHDHNIQHIKRDESPIHYFTNGGGSKAWRDDFDNQTTDLKFAFSGQGFCSVEVDKSYLKLKFYGVFGSKMYSYTLRK